MGFSSRQRPQLPLCTDPFIILLCSVALKFAIEDLLSQAVEATEVVVFDVPSRLSKFYRNLIEGITFKKMKPDRLPLALGQGFEGLSPNRDCQPVLQANSPAMPLPREDLSVRRQRHRCRRPCRSIGRSDIDAGIWPVGTSSAESRTSPNLSSCQRSCRADGLTRRCPELGRQPPMNLGERAVPLRGRSARSAGIVRIGLLCRHRRCWRAVLRQKDPLLLH